MVKIKEHDDPFEELLAALEDIKKKLPNGELTDIKKSIEEITEDQSIIKAKITEINKRILDPDTGLIVKVNRQGELLYEAEEEHGHIIKEYPELKNRLCNIEKWQAGINKALWLIFGSIIALTITALFQLITLNNPN